MARLIVRRKGTPEQTVEISSPVVTLGRSKDNTFILRGDRKISRRHAKIDYVDGKFYITDMGSANGTSVNERLIRSRTPLRDGDKINIGDTELIFFSDGGLSPAAEPEPISPEELAAMRPRAGNAPGAGDTAAAAADASTVKCPNCGTVVDVTDIPKGAKVGCARCKHIFTV